MNRWKTSSFINTRVILNWKWNYKATSAFYIFNPFNKSLYKDTVRHLIRYKYTDKFKNVLGVPMEDNRLNSNIIEIEENINNLRRSIIGIPIEFLFKLDEMGVSEYEDGRSKTVIVPINYSNCTAPYPVSRKGKHCTCLQIILFTTIYFSKK